MQLKDVYITNTASFLPNKPVDNDGMENILGQAGPKPSRARRIILRSNGIKTRHYAIDPDSLQPTHSNAELAAHAVSLLQYPEFSLNSLESLSCGTSIADHLMPSHAVMVQGELKLPACEVVSTAGVCTSGMSALKFAMLNIASGEKQSAAASGSELSSAMMAAKHFQGEIDAQVDELQTRPEIAFEKDFLRWMLSDGAGAFLLQAQPREDELCFKIDWLELLSSAGEMEACMYAGATKNTDGSLNGWQHIAQEPLAGDSVMAVKQDVKLLNEKVIEYTLEKPLAALIAKHQLDKQAIDWFVPHYSSMFFEDKVREGLENIGFGIKQERWYSNLTRCGNTGSASIYIMLDELRRSGKLKRGEKLLCYIPESSRFSTAWMHLTVV